MGAMLASHLAQSGRIGRNDLAAGSPQPHGLQRLDRKGTLIHLQASTPQASALSGGEGRHPGNQASARILFTS